MSRSRPDGRYIGGDISPLLVAHFVVGPASLAISARVIDTIPGMVTEGGSRRLSIREWRNRAYEKSHYHPWFRDLDINLLG
jgi:hypothetical protein